MDENSKPRLPRRPPMEDPMWLHWQSEGPELYDKISYHSNPVVAHIHRMGHKQLEKPFGPQAIFNRVLEVGAGTGVHLDYVRHRFLRYTATDISMELLDKAEEKARKEGLKLVEFELADATSLPYPDSCFDRLISVYNLEHLPTPHEVLKEWKRVVVPGGTISIAITAEGSMAWNLSRRLTTRKSFARKGLNMDYILAREQINSCYRLAALIRYYFLDRQESWYPIKLPISHLNLVYSVNVTVDK